MQENIAELLLKGQYSNPHRILGLKNVGDQSQVIRLWQPGAANCQLEVKGSVVSAQRIDEGLFEYQVAGRINPTDYRVKQVDGKLSHDPYAFEHSFGELDQYLVRKGLHYELYDLLGATPSEHFGVKGINFAVWAPNAISVALIGDFNRWDVRVNPMRHIETTGVWDIFIPGLDIGEKYKYVIVTKDGRHIVKADPVMRNSEMRPHNASVVCDVDRFAWSDGQWMEKRRAFRKGSAPVNIYELHLGSWKADKNYRELAHELAKYCLEMYYTHVELVGILEHPLDESWGYQVTGYFAPTSRYGSPEDFQYLVNHLHAHSIGVILDWVPAHFPSDGHSLACFDGTYLYEHEDPRQGFHPHWNTHIFNFGRYEVSNFLIASALFWLKKMHIDGLRVDAVASMLYLDYGREHGQWIPNRLGTNVNLEAFEFIKHLNSIVHEQLPDVLMIAEESTAFPLVTFDPEMNGLGFDLKWNMGWMHDTLKFFMRDFYEKGKYLSEITWISSYSFFEKFALVLSHDEVVHGKKSLLSKMPGSDWDKFAGVRLLLSFMISFPGKKLTFMGGELGQWTEWDCKAQLPWHLLNEPWHAKLHKMIREINRIYVENGALYERDYDYTSIEWLIHSDHQNVVIAYLRKGYTQTILCVHHFHPGHIEDYQIPLRGVKQVTEIFNSDSEEWNGSGMLRPKAVGAKESISLTIPPLATLLLEVEFDDQSKRIS